MVTDFCIGIDDGNSGYKSCPLILQGIALFLTLISLALVTDSTAQSVYVPLNHWAYEYVERLETKGLIQGSLNGTDGLKIALQSLLRLAERRIASIRRIGLAISSTLPSAA